MPHFDKEYHSDTGSSSEIPIFPHLNSLGQAHMIDVSQKKVTTRQARATAFVRCSPKIMAALQQGELPKGDALAVARVAGIAAVKHTPFLLPLAHPVTIHHCSVDLQIESEGIAISAQVKANDVTGIEMEALTAVTIAGLTLIDMVKGIDKLVSLEKCQIVEKSGGRSGKWSRSEH